MTSTSSPTEPVLRWRIPEGRNRVSLRFALVQIAFATVIVGLLVLFLTPGEAHQGLLTATIVIALLLAAVQIVRSVRDAQGLPNVWLDDAGLHWRDAAGREQSLSRSLAQSFRIGHDEETRRELASLTLVLEEGFVSQPVELHAPADEPRVRKWLMQRWSLPETASLPDDPLVRIGVASERDMHKQHWFFRGDLQGLAQLAAVWSDAARWPLPPVGARPKQMEIELDGESLLLAVAPHTWIDRHLFSATPELLRQLAGEIEAKLPLGSSLADFEIPLVTDTGHHWRLIFQIADAK
jgi:hypothetical protein